MSRRASYTRSFPDLTGWEREDDTWRGKGFVSFHNRSSGKHTEVVFVRQEADDKPHIAKHWRTNWPNVYAWYFESGKDTYSWMGQILFVKLPIPKEFNT